MEKISKEAFDRLQKEYAELEKRRDKLTRFVYSDRFGRLSDHQKDLLYLQRSGMSNYAIALRARIRNLLKEKLIEGDSE